MLISLINFNTKYLISDVNLGTIYIPIIWVRKLKLLSIQVYISVSRNTSFPNFTKYIDI